MTGSATKIEYGTDSETGERYVFSFDPARVVKVAHVNGVLTIRRRFPAGEIPTRIRRSEMGGCFVQRGLLRRRTRSMAEALTWAKLDPEGKRR